jgi:hypothetical protein
MPITQGAKNIRIGQPCATKYRILDGFNARRRDFAGGVIFCYLSPSFFPLASSPSDSLIRCALVSGRFAVTTQPINCFR